MTVEMEGRRELFGVVLATIVVGAFGFNDEMAELARMLRENCIEETGVDAGLLKKVDGGAELMPDPKLKCYIKCVMETAGMMSDGEVDVEAVVALLPDDFRKKNEVFLRECGTKHGADHCDNAFLTQACWQNANKADYFLI